MQSNIFHKFLSLCTQIHLLSVPPVCSKTKGNKGLLMTKDTLVMSSNWQSCHNNNSWLHTHYFTQCRVQVILECLSWRVPLLVYTTLVHYNRNRTLIQQRFKNKLGPRTKEIFSVFMYTIVEGVQSKRSSA